MDCGCNSGIVHFYIIIYIKYRAYALRKNNRINETYEKDLGDIDYNDHSDNNIKDIENILMNKY